MIIFNKTHPFIIIFLGDLFHWVLYDEVSNDLAYNNSNKQGLVDWENNDTLTFTGKRVTCQG